MTPSPIAPRVVSLWPSWKSSAARRPIGWPADWGCKEKLSGWGCSFCVLFFDGDMWWPHMLHEPCTTNLTSCPPGHALLFLHRAMPMSPYQRAKRAFVRVLIGLASSYSVVVGVNRDSDDDTIHMAYRRVVRRVHPDKGGAVADAQQLQAAKDDWDAARKPIRRRGRLQRQEPPHPTVQPIIWELLQPSSAVAGKKFHRCRLQVCVGEDGGGEQPHTRGRQSPSRSWRAPIALCRYVGRG